jgi:hypothetical protein
VRNRTANFVIAILLVVSIGGHWALLQSVAWMTMLVDYSKDAPLSVAVRKTFDGKHPCSLCKIVKHGQETEQKQDSTNLKVKPDSWLLAGAFDFQVAQSSAAPILSAQHIIQPRAESPPVPPPRFA